MSQNELNYHLKSTKNRLDDLQEHYEHSATTYDVNNDDEYDQLVMLHHSYVISRNNLVEEIEEIESRILIAEFESNTHNHV